MRKRTMALPLAVLLVLLVFPTWTAPDKPPQEVEVTNFPAPFRFIGVTTQLFDGGGGWREKTLACFDEFPGARFAFVSEYLLTVNPAQVSEAAWIQDGMGAATTTNCIGWSSNQRDFQSGTTIGSSGSVTAANCDVARPVACAAPSRDTNEPPD